MTRPPARCNGCQVNPVAWVRPRVDYCYACLPGGPFTPPACRRCGSPDYFSEGLCGGCHRGGPRYRDSCRGCLAWGVYRKYSWLCWRCRWWQAHYALDECAYCRRTTRIGEQRACRLCLEQARMLQEPGRALDLAGTNRYGQQLFFANMHLQRRKTPRLQLEPRPGRAVQPTRLTAVDWPQLPLFDVDPDPALVRQRALAATDISLQHYCQELAGEHAARHGWSKRQTNDVIRSLRLLQVLQPSRGAKLNATDVLQLPRYNGNIQSTLDVLAAAGLLNDDRPSHVERYFAGKTGGLPEPMSGQLQVWLEVLLEGSTTPPRQRSRDPQTARLHILAIAPIVHGWAAEGHRSLVEITAEQITAALPSSGARRYLAESGLRSLFTTLKARKLIFANPTRGRRRTRSNTTTPLPVETETIRESLNSPDPAIALAVALVAFHALTSKQIGDLQLTDIVDGRLTLSGRVIPLAGPARVRLAAWLDHRARTWPGSANPHLLINRKTAPRLTRCGRYFPWVRAGISPQALREDRILQECHATGGDVRRICDLFGLTVDAALRYATTLGHPALAGAGASGSETHDPR